MNITDTRRRRVIIDTDAANEADDQFAIVQALLSPSLDIRGLVAAHFGTRRAADSVGASRAEIERIIALLGPDSPDVRVADGAGRALPDEYTPVDSPGARLIIEEAHRAEAGPLFVGFLGPLTDMASALLLDPTIAQTDTIVIWVGGPGYDSVNMGLPIEFNLGNDIASANVVFASGMRVWQVPASIYRLIGVGYAELRRRIEPHGEIGRYLTQVVHDFNRDFHLTPIESRSLGDSPAIGLMLAPFSAQFREQAPVRFADDGLPVPSEVGSPVWVVEQYDTRYLLEDMFAKLEEHGERARNRLSE